MRRMATATARVARVDRRVGAADTAPAVLKMTSCSVIRVGVGCTSTSEGGDAVSGTTSARSMSSGGSGVAVVDVDMSGFLFLVLPSLSTSPGSDVVLGEFLDFRRPFPTGNTTKPNGRANRGSDRRRQSTDDRVTFPSAASGAGVAGGDRRDGGTCRRAGARGPGRGLSCLWLTPERPGRADMT